MAAYKLTHLRLTQLLTLMETGPLSSRWKPPSWSKATLHSGLKWILKAEVSIMFELYQDFFRQILFFFVAGLWRTDLLKIVLFLSSNSPSVLVEAD